MRGVRSDISRERLIFISFFLILLLFPYLYFGYLAFFPDIFCVLVVYWVVSDEQKSFGAILISGLLAVLRVFFGGSPFAGAIYVLFGLASTFFPQYFAGNIFSVILWTPVITFLTSLVVSFDFSEFFYSIFLSLLKLLSTTIFAVIIFPLLFKERRKILI